MTLEERAKYLAASEISAFYRLCLQQLREAVSVERDACAELVYTMSQDWNTDEEREKLLAAAAAIREKALGTR